jgi:DNA-binding response OmpR family regulator
VVAPSRAPTLPLTVTISVDGGAPEARAHLLATLHELVAAAGRDVVSVAEPMGEPGVVHVDPEPRAAFRDGRLLELSRLEYDLLLFFARHPRQVFTRGQLLSEVWGHVHAGARTVDVHVSRLRQKLGGSGELITTVYGVGYRLADAAPVRVVPPRAGSRSWTA